MARKVIFGGVPGMIESDIKKMEQYVLEECPDVDFYFFGEQTICKEELLKIGKDADVIISWDQEMDDEIYSSLNLIAYCAASTGFNAANIDAATRNDVYVANVSDYCMDEVATHSVTLILSLYRRLYTMVDYIKEGKWDLAPMDGVKRFENSTVGLMGFGRIPRKIAKKLHGFGMDIIAYDPFISKEDMDKVGVRKVDMDELLKESDYLSLHTPLMGSTKNIINEDSIDKMKDGVFLVNTARGGLVDEEALLNALDSGKIRAAGLDVLVDEPPNEIGKKLIAHKNTIVTGHSSYVSLEASDEQIRKTAINVAKFLSGEIPKYTLNQIKKNQRN